MLEPCPLPLSFAFSTPGISIAEGHISAYKRACKLEKVGGGEKWPDELAAPDTETKQWPQLKPQVSGRILGYLLRESYHQYGADAVAREILGCGDGASPAQLEYNLADLARFYRVTLLKSCAYDCLVISTSLLVIGCETNSCRCSQEKQWKNAKY